MNPNPIDKTTKRISIQICQLYIEFIQIEPKNMVRCE